MSLPPAKQVGGSQVSTGKDLWVFNIFANLISKIPLPQREEHTHTLTHTQTHTHTSFHCCPYCPIPTWQKPYQVSPHATLPTHMPFTHSQLISLICPHLGVGFIFCPGQPEADSSGSGVDADGAQPPHGENSKEQQGDLKVGAGCGAESALGLCHVTDELSIHTYTQPCTVPADTPL